MKSETTDLTGVSDGDIICSIAISPCKKWQRTIADRDGVMVDIHKLAVERSLNSGDIWILCLHNRDINKQTHVFYLNWNKTRVRVWKKIDKRVA